MHLTCLFIVFAYLTEQNTKLVDLKLKKRLEVQPQVSNPLTGASQKAVTQSSEHDVKVNLTCFEYLTWYLCILFLLAFHNPKINFLPNSLH